MEIFDAVWKALLALVAAVGGPTAIIKLFEAAKVRAEAKKVSEDGHKETQRLLTEEVAELRKLAQAATAEAAAMRAERDALREESAAKDRKIAQMAAVIQRQAAALPPAMKSATKKD